MDETNDGLMNAFEWRLDNQPGIKSHAEMMTILENVCTRHPRTTFIPCHFANCCYDLQRLASMLDKHPNLYADIAARYLYWGVRPFPMSQGRPPEAWIAEAEQRLTAEHLCRPGDIVAVVSGTMAGQVGGSNMLKLHKIGSLPSGNNQTLVASPQS